MPKYFEYSMMRETAMATIVSAREISPPDTIPFRGENWISRDIEWELDFTTSSGESVRTTYNVLLAGTPERVSDSVVLKTGYDVSVTYNPARPHAILLSSDYRSRINFMLLVNLVFFLCLVILVVCGVKKFRRIRAKYMACSDLFDQSC
jgi:hypothetical protein